MRTLLIVFNRTGKGTYWRAYGFGRELARRGHEVTLLSMSPTRHTGISEHMANGMRLAEAGDLLWGPLRSGWDPYEISARLLWLRRQQRRASIGHPFDVIHAFECRPTVLYPALAARRMGAALVMDWCDWFGQGGSVEERPNPLIRTILRSVETHYEEKYRTRADATTVICTTLWNKAAALGVPVETIRLIRSGGDLSVFRPQDRLQARQALGLPADVEIVGYVGAIFRRDAALMAQAFCRLRKIRPAVRLLLVGSNLDASSMGVSPEVVYTTPRLAPAQVNDHLAACDVCWLPLVDSNANRGRWPSKLNDYLAAGRPVVATAVGDVDLVLRQHGAGRVLPDDPTVFAEATDALLADAMERKQLEANARQLAETEFDWSRLTEDLEDLYRQAIERRKAC